MYENVLINSDKWYSDRDFLNEKWKPFTYNDKTYYEVSNYGRCKSITRTRLLFNGVPCVQVGKLIKPIQNDKGYWYYGLSYDGKRKNFNVHNLVAMLFIDKESFKYHESENKSLVDIECLMINHKDENPSNNRVDNLEWCTHTYNINYGTRTSRVVDKCSKSIEQYSLEGEYIKTWKSLANASSELNISRGTLCSCLKGQIKSCGGYQWKYTGSDKVIRKYTIKKPIRKIYQLDLNNNVLAVYDNLHDAERKTGVWMTQIRKCCEKLPMYKTAKGYKWCWEDDYIGK